ncbi:MAG: TonB-dependent receptor [Bacteroidia bacterium]|nr:TonB-dependent receptor [Bacteroidia bacterium]
MRIPFWFIVITLFACGNVYGQCAFSLAGAVKDAETGEGLAFTSVWIKETGQGAYADSNGYFILTDLCQGDYTVVVAHTGCEMRNFLIHIPEKSRVIFSLSHTLENLDAVIIRGKSIAPRRTQSESFLSGNDLSKESGQTLGKILEKIPGIAALQTGITISKPVLNGLHSNRLLILNNDVRQEAQQWGGEHAPEIDPMAAGKITVVKGANAVRYGPDAMAGVIIIDPFELRDSSGWEGSMNVSAMSNSRQGLISGRIGHRLRGKMQPLSWQFQGTLKQGGNIRTPDYFLKNTGVKEANFGLSAGWNKEDYGILVYYSRFHTNVGIFSGSHIGNLTDLMAAFQGTKPVVSSGFSYEITSPYQNIVHNLAKAEAFWKVTNAGKISLILASQHNLREEYDSHKPEVPSLKYAVNTTTADLVFEHNRRGNWMGTWGLSGMTQANRMSGSRYFLPNYVNLTGGAFGIERWRKDKWELEAGLRYDYRFLETYGLKGNEIVTHSYRFSNVSGSLGGIFHASDQLHFTFNAGRAWRSPGVNELFSNGLHHGAAALEIGDSTMKMENAWKAILTTDFQAAHWLIQVTPYVHYFENYIYLAPTGEVALTVRGAFPVFRYKQTQALLNGLDYRARYTLNPHWEVESSGAVIRARNLILQGWLFGIPSDRFTHAVTWKPGWHNHHLEKFFSNAYFSVNFRHILKQTRISGEQDFAPAPKGYGLLGLEAGMEIPLMKQEASLNLACDNLLNIRYRDYMDRFRYFSDAQGRNVRLQFSIKF